MKSILMIGMGRFGSHLCMNLSKLNNEIMIVDECEEKLAVSLSSDEIFDFINLTDGYSIYEISPLPEWIGKSILDLNFRARYHMSIIGIKSGSHTQILPSVDYIFKKEEHLMVICHQNDMDQLIQQR